MDRIFNADNKFFRGLSKIVDCIILSACWTICNFPMIVICSGSFGSGYYGFMALGLLAMILSGPATSALYYAVVKNIRNSHSYAWKEFWHGFASSFKQASVAGVILYALILLFAADIYVLVQFFAEAKFSVIRYIFMLLIFFAVMWGVNLFSYIARFENTFKDALKNSILIGIASLPKSFVMAVWFAFCIFVCVSLSGLAVILTFILPAVYMLLKSFILEKTFRKFMSEEDRAAEDEKNRDYKN